MDAAGPGDHNSNHQAGVRLVGNDWSIADWLSMCARWEGLWGTAMIENVPLWESPTPATLPAGEVGPSLIGSDGDP